MKACGAGGMIRSAVIDEAAKYLATWHSKASEIGMGGTVQAETDRPLFRVGLTVAGLWSVILGGWGFYSYENVRRPLGYPDEMSIARCDNTDFFAKAMGINPATPNEIQHCIDQLTKSAASDATDKYRRERREEATSFFFLTVLPPAITLFLCAYWRSIFSGVRRAAERYLLWVRTGKDET